MDVSFMVPVERARRNLARLVPRVLAAGSLALMGLGVGVATTVHAAPSTNNVYILGSSVTGGAASLEAQDVLALGLNPIVLSNAAWAALTPADFAASRGIVIGDPTCSSSPSRDAAAVANSAVWGPTITGNIVVIGTDPVYHQFQGGSKLVKSGIAFTFADATNAGAYLDQSCEAGSFPGPQPLLAQFGVFDAKPAGCFDSIHIVASHPALAGLTDADLSGWGCSVHNNYDVWPTSFIPLAIDVDAGAAFTAPDGTKGNPYILARGAGLVPCTVDCGTGVVPPVTGATPELDSLLLFGAGAAGLAGYARMRLLAGRRRTQED